MFTDGKLKVSCNVPRHPVCDVDFRVLLQNIKIVEVLKTFSSQVMGRVLGPIEDSVEDFSDQIKIPNDR